MKKKKVCEWKFLRISRYGFDIHKTSCNHFVDSLLNFRREQTCPFCMLKIKEVKNDKQS